MSLKTRIFSQYGTLLERGFQCMIIIMVEDEGVTMIRNLESSEPYAPFSNSISIS